MVRTDMAETPRSGHQAVRLGALTAGACCLLVLALAMGGGKEQRAVQGHVGMGAAYMIGYTGSFADAGSQGAGGAVGGILGGEGGKRLAAAVRGPAATGAANAATRVVSARAAMMVGSRVGATIGLLGGPVGLVAGTFVGAA